MKKLEQFAKLLPLATVFLILCSSAQLIIYYNFFNINIVNYLNSEEYLTLFIDDILYYLAVFGIGLFFYLIDETEKSSAILKHSKLSNGVYLLIFGVLLFLIGLVLYSGIEKSSKAENIGVIVFLMSMILYFYMSWTSLNFTYPLWVSLAILIYTISYSIRDAYRVLENDKSRSFEFVYKEMSLKTDCNFLYLGSSKEYNFFYSPEVKRSYIYKKG